MREFKLFSTACALCFFFASSVSASADTILWVSDQNGNIGQVDVTTQSVVAGSVHPTGQPLTDIAFTSDGTLYGTTNTNLFLINPNTGAATNLGAYGPDFTSVTALVGDGTGLLLATSDGDGPYMVMQVPNPTAPSGLVPYATSPRPSEGDLAFHNGNLYESVRGVIEYDELVNVSTDTDLGNFSDVEHFNDIDGSYLAHVGGLADNGTTLYAVQLRSIYSVSLPSAAVTRLFDYSLAENGQDLGYATGAAFTTGVATPTSPVPEPASFAIFGIGLGALSFIRRRRA